MNQEDSDTEQPENSDKAQIIVYTSWPGQRSWVHDAFTNSQNLSKTGQSAGNHGDIPKD